MKHCLQSYPNLQSGSTNRQHLLASGYVITRKHWIKYACPTLNKTELHIQKRLTEILITNVIDQTKNYFQKKIKIRINNIC